MTSTQTSTACYTGLAITFVVEQDCLGTLAERGDYDRYREMVRERIAARLPGATVRVETGLSSRTEFDDSDAAEELDGMTADGLREECREASRHAYADFCRS